MGISLSINAGEGIVEGGWYTLQLSTVLMSSKLNELDDYCWDQFNKKDWRRSGMFYYFRNKEDSVQFFLRFAS